MPRPDVLLGEESRAGMLRGFESMARLLAITLGPIAGTIGNAREPNGEPELLNDAATVARRIIEFPDRAEDAGAMLMRHIVWNVREEVGDGSATTAVLAWSIVREMRRMIAAGANAMLVKCGIEKAIKVALETLDEISRPLEGEEQIAAVATAAVGYPEIGKLLGEIYDILGPNASIVIEPYIATYHDRVYHEGTRIRGGYLSPYLLTDDVRRIAVLDDAYILIADMVIESVETVRNLLEQVVKAGGDQLFIICKQISDKAIGVLTANKDGDIVQSCAANLKPVGDLRRGTMEDIAILTGGKALTDKANMDPASITIDQLGKADRIIVTKDHYINIGGQGDKEAIRERLKRLRQSLRKTTDAEEREMLRELVTHFSAGIGELRIGALTEQERSDLTDIAEQAMKAVAAGMESGIVPGGGAAYLACIPAVEAIEVEGDEAIGVDILARALEAPMRRIVSNAGMHPPLAIVEARRKGVGYGFEVYGKKVVDMIEEGVADPTMIVKRALQQAVSGATMLLTTDALVLHRKPEETCEP